MNGLPSSETMAWAHDVVEDMVRALIRMDGASFEHTREAHVFERGHEGVCVVIGVLASAEAALIQQTAVLNGHDPDELLDAWMKAGRMAAAEALNIVERLKGGAS